MTGPWTVVLTDAADRDIDDIVAESIRLFGPAQARAYEELLAAAISDLRGRPKLIGSVSRNEIAVGFWTRRIARRGRRASHQLLYRAVDPKQIEIVRILHERMDLARHLPQS